MEKPLFLFIQNLLPAAVKTFDWWNNQFETESEEDSVDTPAVFCEIQPYETLSFGQKRQRATLQFNLYIGQQLYARMGKGSRRQSQALAHLQLCDDIFAKLQGKNNGSTIMGITRTNITPDHSFRGYIVHVHTYKCTIVTDASVRPTIPIPANPNLEVEI